MDKEIVIKPTFDAKDYYKIDQYLLIKRPFLWICIALVTFVVILSLLTGDVDFALKSLLFFLMALAFLFYATFRATKKKLQNYRLKEEIYCKLSPECMEDAGESFNTKYFWKNIIKIVEKKRLVFNLCIKKLCKSY